MSPLLPKRPQQLAEKSVNLPLYLNEPLGLATCVTAQGLGNQRQTCLLVGLAARHRPLRKKNQMAPLARAVVKQLHEGDAVASDAESQRVRILQGLTRRTLAPYRMAVVEI